MKTTAFAVAATLALSAVGYVTLFSASAASSQDIPAACDFLLEDVKPSLAANSIPFTVITDPAEIAAFVAQIDPVPEGVTAILIADMGGTLLYGLEIGGCLLPPVPLELPPERLGGTNGGKTGA